MYTTRHTTRCTQPNTPPDGDGVRDRKAGRDEDTIVATAIVELDRQMNDFSCFYTGKSE
jgi:hypothetical protein